jgi:hypothetical protein
METLVAAVDGEVALPKISSNIAITSPNIRFTYWLHPHPYLEIGQVMSNNEYLVTLNIVVNP